MSLRKLCSFFPKSGLGCRCARTLKVLGMEPERYLSMALAFSAVFSFACSIVMMVLGVGPLLPLGLLGFALPLGLFLVLPDAMMGKRSAEMEAEMPYFLRALGMLLDMGIPFDKALDKAAGGALREELAPFLEEVKRGMGMQSAFTSLARSTDSLVVKRALSQVVTAYEVGGSGAEMRRIGDELLSLEQHRLKEYSARSSMFGLLFIMTSAIAPTFFLVYAVAGRFVLSQEMGTDQMAIAMLVVFPMASILVMLVSKATMPRSALSSGQGFDAMLLLPGLLFLMGFFLDMQVAGLICGAAAGAYLILANHGKERRLEEIEERLPDALFSVSGLPRSTRPERIFEIMAQGHGALSEEAKKSGRQLGMNVSLDAVLDDLGQRNRSRMLERACMMMKQMVHTDSLDRLNMLAEDIIASFQIKRKRSQAFAMQKYTLVFGAFLIALILRMTLFLLQSMAGLMEEPVGGMAFAESVVPPYLVIYALISATAIADAEGKRSALAIYSLALAGLGLAAFHFLTF